MRDADDGFKRAMEMLDNLEESHARAYRRIRILYFVVGVLAAYIVLGWIR